MDSLPEEIFTELKQQFQKIKLHLPSSSNKHHEQQVQDSGDGIIKDDANLLETEFSLVASKLEEILTKLKTESSDYFLVLSMVGSILYEKSKMSLNTNNFEKSKEYLDKALGLIKGHMDNPQISFLYMRIINYLSFVHTRMGDLDSAKSHLESIVLSELKCEPNVYSTEDLFTRMKNEKNLDKTKVEKLMINNMQMLGWIYGKQGQGDLYADIIHKSLQKEMDLDDTDPIMWATRCYRLASLFLSQDKWENARYHLTAAQTVLDPLEVGMTPNILLFKTQAEMARVWVNYGLQLFSISKKSILQKMWEDSEEIKKPDVPVSTKPSYEFVGVEVKVPSIPAKEIENIQEARELFTHTHKWLKRARLFYTLRDYPLQYVNIILELSELYRYLAFYEKDLDSQYDVHKKRYETLETLSTILREVRPSCYQAVCVEIIREIMEVQIELMNLNLKRLYSPSDDADLDEDELQKRINTVAHINAKIDHLCNVDHSKTAVDLTGNEVSTQEIGEDTEEGVKQRKAETHDAGKNVEVTAKNGDGEGNDQKKES
ncbi:unnamed protein product [Phaedon cochleariae]|uniref:KIF-binding protein n=1 Tax=Phaedon cochleariae TaxID=80249 RepID=A0A9P0DE62_PHACE|nr:unnamed protein product [Phaedon cochleariae]